MNPDWQVKPGNTHPAHALALAAGVSAPPQVLSVGGVQATGTFTFTGNVAVGDTLKINGITYSFVATGGAGHTVTIGANANASIDALIAAYTAAADAANAGITLARVGGNLVVTAPHWSNDGNLIPLAETSASVSCPATLSGGVEVVVSPDTEDTVFTIGTTAQHFYLRKGIEGQRHTLLLDTVGGGGSAVVHFNTWTHSVTFTASNQFANLKFLNGSWRVLVDTGTYA